MDGLKINFKLQQIDKITPWGESPDFSMHWFGLTDSQLWIQAGGQTIYEYSYAAREYFGENIQYNNYQLSRFLEDFSELFPYLRESVPELFYEKINDFEGQTYAWLMLHDEDEDNVFDKLYDDEYTPLTAWYYDRMLDSGHLTGGPDIGCYRYGDRIKLCWKSDYQLENGSSIWTAPRGIFELQYKEFVSAVNEFYHSFFKEMDKQVDLAVQKDWGNVRLDKTRLIDEHAERKEFFNQKLKLLSEPCNCTDWDAIIAIYNGMGMRSDGNILTGGNGYV